MAYQDKIQIVAGKKTKDILIYSLSTCFWCDKAKEYLDKLGLEYRYLVVDSLEGAEQQEAIAEISKYNQNLSFPTIVINNGERAFVGFSQEEFDNLAK